MLLLNLHKQNDYEVVMSKVYKVDHTEKNYLVKVDYEKRTRVYALFNRKRMTTSNVAEYINSYLMVAEHDLPILNFLK